MLSNYMDHDFHAPTKHDFDKNRFEIPIEAWGSDQYRCDVVASQAHQLLRFGRIDEKRTIPLRSQDVIMRYKFLAGVKKNGDENDIGLYALEAFRNWQRFGWHIRDKKYKIMYYGEIEPNERDLIRTAIYLFRGVHFGFWLPQGITESILRWEYHGESSEIWKPGSLGGHLAYSKAYDQDGYEILSWGRPIYVTNDFVEKFCDEIWIAIEEVDYWVETAVDVDKLKNALLSATSSMKGR